MDDPAPELLTLNDVAEILRCSKAHVSKAVRGEVHGITPIPAIGLGRRKLVRRESLLQWIEANDRRRCYDTVVARSRCRQPRTRRNSKCAESGIKEAVSGSIAVRSGSGNEVRESGGAAPFLGRSQR